MSIPTKLSKSNYMEGLKCQKRLWYKTHEPDLGEPPTPYEQRIMDGGTEVGIFAQKLFPGGKLIQAPYWDLKGAAEEIRHLMAENEPFIYEAAAVTKEGICRVDILKKVPGQKDVWDIYEVKAAKGHYPPYLDDIAYQKHVFETAGITIRKCFLVHINPDFKKNGEIKPKKFFSVVELTDEVEKRMPLVPESAAPSFKTLGLSTAPSIEIGNHCESGGKCPFFDQCHVTGKDTIYKLPNRKNLIPILEARNIFHIKDIPKDVELNAKQEKVVEAVKTMKPIIDREAIKAHLDELVYPIYYLDFETVSSPLPFFEGSSPYGDEGFQYSLHIQKKKGGKTSHHYFLGEGKGDERRQLAESLLEKIGPEGSIVAYNIGFEIGVIKRLAHVFPDLAKSLLAMPPRFWDLMSPFQAGDYMHPDFGSRYSIKIVLPALIPELAYSDLPINDGGTASITFMDQLAGKLSKKEWARARDGLLKYCHLDTLAMVRLVEHLYGVVKGLK